MNRMPVFAMSCTRSVSKAVKHNLLPFRFTAEAMLRVFGDKV